MFIDNGPIVAINTIKTYLITHIGLMEEPVKSKMLEIILSDGAETIVKGTTYLYSALVNYEMPDRAAALFAVGTGALQLALVGLWGRGEIGWQIYAWANYELNGGPIEIMEPDEDTEFYFYQ